MEDNIQTNEQQNMQIETAEQQPVEQNVDNGEFNFTDEDIQFAQWALTLGGYMRSLLQDPARAAEEFEAAARALREMHSQPEQEQPKQPKQEQQQNMDINAIVQQAVEQAVGKMFEQMKKQALASPPGLAGRAVSSKRLADLIE